MTYRKDIQILRGIAILFVVLFHLNITGFQSGFLGVDIFFVISGFLMAIIYDNISTRAFYKRRVLRILPAYFITVLVTIIASIIVLKPNEYNQVINQAIYADLFASNIGYWMQNSYFSKREFNPLLHLWSLGVEIQYYLIIPILFYFLRRSKACFYIIFLGSLLLCFKIIEISPKTSFFMMPLRIWEFLIGYGVATYVTKDGNISTTQIKQRISSVFFIIIICIPFFRVKESFNFMSGHPGICALMITISTGIVIAYGINSYFEDSIFGTTLELLGKYSYSIYMVHFPLIVLYSYKPFSGTRFATGNILDQIVLIALIAGLSFGMYHLIEKKLRSYKKINIVLYTAPIVVIAITLSGSYIQQNIFTEKEMLIFNAFNDTSSYRCGKVFRFLNPTSITCEISGADTDNAENIILVGNSHADSIKTTFSNTATQHNTGLYFLVPNDPLMNNSKVSASSLVDEAVKHKVSTIVLHFSHGGIEAIGFSKLNKLVDLASKKHIFVAFIMPVPVWENHVPRNLWENFKYNKPLQKKTKYDYQKKTEILRNALSHITSDNFRVYEVYKYLCKDMCEVIDSNGKPLYYDAHHLTLTGSRRLSELFDTIINDGKTYIKNKKA